MPNQEANRIGNHASLVILWILAHLLNDRQWLDRVRTETGKSFRGDRSIDGSVLFDQCLHVDACWREALRMYNGVLAVREAVQACCIGGMNVQKGQ